jgi:hypothetical protein
VLKGELQSGPLADWRELAPLRSWVRNPSTTLYNVIQSKCIVFFGMCSLESKQSKVADPLTYRMLDVPTFLMKGRFQTVLTHVTPNFSSQQDLHRNRIEW